MKFKGIETVDIYKDVAVYGADLSDMPEVIQEKAREVDGAECDGQRFGVYVGYNFAEKEFFIFTDKLPPMVDGNIYYMDKDGDIQWFQADVRAELTELTKQIFNACDRINTGIDTPQGYTIQKTVQFCDGTGLVLAKKDDRKYPFINWKFKQTAQGHRQYTWGYCHPNEQTAREAFENAIAAHIQHERADVSSPAKVTVWDAGQKPSIRNQLAAKPVPGDKPVQKSKDREVR